MHARLITIYRQIKEQLPQLAQARSWALCVEGLAAHVCSGATVHACCEAGPCGFGLHLQPTVLGWWLRSSETNAGGG